VGVFGHVPVYKISHLLDLRRTLYIAALCSRSSSGSRDSETSTEWNET
jgi:hypothetical protein